MLLSMSYLFEYMVLFPLIIICAHKLHDLFHFDAAAHKALFMKVLILIIDSRYVSD